MKVLDCQEVEGIGIVVTIEKAVKNQFIVLPNGEDIVDVIVGKLGKTSDINLFRVRRDQFAPQQKFLGDKAYKGDAAIATPHKKTKNNEITEIQKEENKELSSRRIGVEHLIGRIKIFKIASERFRLGHKKYNRVIMTVCGLVRFRMNQVFILALNS
ncbi:MAG: transposase family protein [Desmonostoc vinosum HA7617-LM4]|nr:transposase family protein [Desmonostoc vinosum HA7617-LM4]